MVLFPWVTFHMYSEENKYLTTLLFCKFSHLEIMEGSEIVIVVACPKKKKKTIWTPVYQLEFWPSKFAFKMSTFTPFIILN